MAKLIKIDKNGTKYYEGYIACDRCDGKGYYAIGVCNGQLVLSPVDNGICFKCGGAGKVISKWKEYTPEHKAKLAEQRRKRAEKAAAKYEAQRAEQEKQRQEEEAKAKEEENRIKQEKAKSQFYGNVGDKVEIKVIYKFTAWYDCKSFYGYGEERHYIHTFKAGDNVLVWKTTHGLNLEEESTVTLKGTIKEHNEYKEEKQTILTRCKVIE